MKQVNGVPVYDTLDELIAPDHTAVVVVDVQNDFCHPDGHFAHAGKDLSLIEDALPRMRRLVSESQALGIATVFVTQQTLPDNASDSPAWLRFKTRDGKAPDYTIPGSWGAELVDGLAVRQEDLVVPKFRPDAFLRTNLDSQLRARGIETVVVLGVVTEGCVESTVRTASYLDYYVVVVRDAVASPNRVQHDGSLRLFEARYPLHDCAELLAAWHRSRTAAAAADAAR